MEQLWGSNNQLMQAAQQFMHDDDLTTLLTYYHASPPELCTYNNSDLCPRPPQLPLPPAGEDRKRKTSTDAERKDAKLEVADAKKQVHGSRTTKRSRVAAEAHNVSERERRKRINEKMKALRELVPRCNKTDKVSMLDDAIEYLKVLKQLVQMMSMGYGCMVPVFPCLANSSFNLQPVSLSHQFATQFDNLSNLHLLQIPNEPHISNLHRYQPYLDVHPTQSPPAQNQAMMQQSNIKSRSTNEDQNYRGLYADSWVA